jgi:hypothetical protein
MCNEVSPEEGEMTQGVWLGKLSIMNRLNEFLLQDDLLEDKELPKTVHWK